MRSDRLKATGGGGFVPEICLWLAMLGALLVALSALFLPADDESDA
jgi:hypothetical protein